MKIFQSVLGYTFILTSSFIGFCLFSQAIINQINLLNLRSEKDDQFLVKITLF